MSDATALRRFFDGELPRLEHIARQLSADPETAIAKQGRPDKVRLASS